MSKLPTNTTRIYYPTPEERQPMMCLLLEMTKSQLSESAAPILQELKKTQLVADKDGKLCEPKEISLMRPSGNKLKVDLAEFLSVVWHSRNFEFISSLIPQDIMPLIREAMHTVCVQDRRVSELLKREVPAEEEEEEVYFSNRSQKKFEDARLKAYFEKSVTYNRHRLFGYYTYITLHPAFRHAFWSCFIPKALPFQFCSELPQDEQLTVYSTEGLYLQLTGVLANLYDSNNLYFHNGKLTAEQIANLSKVFKLKEFFPESKVKAQRQLATIMAASFYTDYRLTLSSQFEDTENDSHKALREAWQEYKEFNHELFCAIMPQLGGVKKSHMEFNIAGEELLDQMEQVLRQLCGQQWIATEQLIRAIYEKSVDSELPLCLFTDYEMADMKLKNKLTSEPILMGNQVEQITLPFIEGFFFLLAALGLTEIAYHIPTKDSISPYAGLRYVRATPLLSYVLGLSRKYTLPTSNHEALFATDDQHMLVRSLSNDNPFEPIVANMSQAVAPHLYKFSLNSFLNGINNCEELEQRITLFKKYVQPHPTPAWEAFFDKVLEHCQPFQSLSFDYAVFQISKDLPELDHLIHTTPELHQYVLRAENGMLAVSPENYKKFTAELRKHGYIF